MFVALLALPASHDSGVVNSKKTNMYQIQQTRVREKFRTRETVCRKVDWNFSVQFQGARFAACWFYRKQTCRFHIGVCIQIRSNLVHGFGGKHLLECKIDFDCKIKYVVIPGNSIRLGSNYWTAGRFLQKAKCHYSRYSYWFRVSSFHLTACCRLHKWKKWLRSSWQSNTWRPGL